MYKIFITLLFIFPLFSAFAQLPEFVKTEQTDNSTAGFRSCVDQFAGTWSRGAFTGSSNDVGNQVMYLCRGDRMDIIGGRDANLSGDPFPETPPGIGYAFYTCPPTVSGSTRNDILNDPCVAQLTPPAAEGISTARGNINGDITINNNGNLQSIFAAGSPVQLWFAPITLDNFSNNSWEGNPAGECINANTDVAFSYIYLNAIEIIDIANPTPTSLEGSFTIRGGLPEFNGSNYATLVIELVSNPAIRGTITNGPDFTHNNIVNFEVPQAGQYRIVASDGKACPGGITFNMPRNAVLLSLSDPVEVALGERFCMDVSVENAIDVVSFQFTINWDPSILRFASVQLPNPNPIFDFTIDNFGLTGQADPVAQGRLNVIWFDLGLNGFSIVDETIIFSVCFDAIGMPGDSSFINFVSTSANPIEFANQSGNILNITRKNSGAKIIQPSDVQIITKTCSTTSNTGSLEFQTFGGTAPYTYNIVRDGGGFEQDGTINTTGESVTINNLPAGNYTITILGTGGGGNFFNVTISNTERLAIDISEARNPACFGQTNGFVQTATVGGTPPYRYNWSNGEFGNPRLSLLGNGTYQVTVTDASGCTAVNSATLNVTPISVVFDAVNPSCLGANNGRITANASGGTGAYTYNWDNTVVGPDRDTYLNLAEGCFNFIMTDARGCRFEQQICLEYEKEISFDIDVQNPFCAGDANGSITATVVESGGTPSNYNFTWNPVAGTVQNSPRVSTLSDVPAGSYIIVAGNADGCRLQQTVNVTNPAGMTINKVTGISASCEEGSSDGGITLSTTGGTGLRTYEWNNGEYTGNTLTNVTAGAYTVTVTDENGCTADSVFYVGPFAGFQITPESCAGTRDGAITTLIEFDTRYTVTQVWNTGATTKDLANLSAGTYSITITGSRPDGEDCILEFEIEVPPAERFSILENHTLPICPGDNNGIINISVVGGQGPFSYAWNHTAINSPILTGQRAGDYVVFISDQSGCPPARFDIVLDQPNLIMFSFAQIMGTTCATNDCDGSAVLSLSSGSVPGGAFEVSWNDNTVQDVTLLTLTGLCEGATTVTAIDENGCRATSSVPIPGPQPITLDLANSIINDVSCNGESDGNALITAAGGTGVYTYEWVNLGTTGPSLNNLSPGTYELVITDSNDCTAEESIVINEPDLFIATVDSDNTQNVGCSGAIDGQITILTAGGNAGILTYNWDPNVSTSGVASNLDAGFYSVTVTDPKGCSDEISYEILEPQPILATIPTPEEPLCNGIETIVTVLQASGGSGGPFSFSVNGGPLLPIGAPYASIAGNLNINVFDARGCSFDTTLVVNNPPAIIVDLGDQIEADLGDTITLDPIVFSPNPNLTYAWSPAMDLSCSDCPNPIAFPSNTSTFQLIVTDENGCSASDQVTLRLLKRRLVYLPTGFTPNNDGINDKFEVYAGKGIRAINHMRIFDRWGNIMLELEDLNFTENGSDGWNGEFKGRMADPGVYVYTVEVEFIDNTTLLYRGEITLYR